MGLLQDSVFLSVKWEHHWNFPQLLRTSHQASHSESREMAAVSSPFVFKFPHKPRGSHDLLLLCHIYHLTVSVGQDPRHGSALSSAQGLTGSQSGCWLELGSPQRLRASPMVLWLLAKCISSPPRTSGWLASSSSAKFWGCWESLPFLCHPLSLF